MNFEEEHQCKYRTECPDYQPSVECDTHLHVRCENFELIYEGEKLLKKSERYDGLEQKVNKSKDKE